MSYYTACQMMWSVLAPVTIMQAIQFASDPIGEWGWTAVMAFCIGMLLPATRDAKVSGRVITLTAPKLPACKRRRRRSIDIDAMLRDLDAEMEAINE